MGRSWTVQKQNSICVSFPTESSFELFFLVPAIFFSALTSILPSLEGSINRTCLCY